MSLQNRMTELANFDNELLIQIDRMAVKAYNETYQPLNKVLQFNPVDERLIAEYKTQFSNKPAYDLEGPELDEPEEEAIANLKGIEKNINEILDAQKYTTKDIQKYTTELKNIINKKELYKTNFNEGKIKSTNENYNKEIKKFDVNIFLITKLLNQQNDEYNNYDALIRKYQLDAKENEAKIKINENKNNEKINRYKEELKILHNRNFTQEKLPSESQEEYLNRIQQDAEVLDNSEILDESRRYNSILFKNNLKELIRNPVIIEQVANNFNIDDKLTINKTFPKFKKIFIENYGVNNPLVEFGDIENYIEQYIGNSQNDTLKSVLSYDFPQIPSQTQVPTSSFGMNIEKLEDCIMITSIPIGYNSPLYLKIGEINDTYILLFSFSNKDGSYNQWVEAKSNLNKTEKPSSNTIFDNTGITLDGLGARFNCISKNGIVKIDILARKIYEEFKLPVLPEKYLNKQGENKKGKIRYGAGVQTEKIPGLIQFGKVVLNVHKLYYKNILSIKNGCRNIPGFKNTAVSERFVKLIMNIIDGIYPTNSEINSLPNLEKQLYDQLIYLAELHKKIPTNHDKTITELKKRMNLIESEFNAGNNSPLLYKELYKICHALHKFGILENKDMKNYLKQFK